MRQWLILAALVAAPWRLSAAACGVNGQMVNGFENTAGCAGEGNDIASWSTGGTAGATITLKGDNGSGTGLAVQEGNSLGVLDWSLGAPAKQIAAALPVASFESPANWGAYDYLYMQYATTATVATAGAVYATAIYLSPAAGAVQGFQVPGNNVNTGVWTPMVLALNYARNMGMTLGSLTGLRIQESTSTNPGGNGFVSFDDLALSTTAQDAPNTQVLASAITPSVSGCNSVTLNWTASVQNGTDPIAGYHIYRSTIGATGPWTSRTYVAFGTNTYADPAVPATAAVYYVVLPFASTTSAFGSGAGNFTQMAGDVGLPGVYGVNEALIDNAQAVMVSNPQSGCSPTPSPSPTKSPSFTPTPSPSFSPTSSFTNSPTMTPSPTITLTSTWTPTLTPSPTLTPTPTVSLTLTVAPPTSTLTASPVFTATTTPSYSVTLTPTTPSVTPTATPSATAGPSSTATIQPTAVPGSPAQLFPNPYHPDQGLFHLGNVKPGLDVSIYNMIGQKVRSFTTVGNPAQDTWNGNNANGVKVVTGIYFVVIQGNVYRLAVVRGQ